MEQPKGTKILILAVKYPYEPTEWKLEKNQEQRHACKDPPFILYQEKQRAYNVIRISHIFEGWGRNF